MIKMELKKPLCGALGKMQLNIELEVKAGEFLAISGKSGSGKTTLLRILAGLEKAEGHLEVFGQTWLEGKKALTPQKRGVGFVFQDYALFPNMSVEQNLLFVAKNHALAKQLLEMTELYTLKHRYPSDLSGGQKQRVALCRAMMNQPKLLLMDEPLSALDPKMRLKLQEEIAKLHETFGTTTIMVSHDPSEIYRLAKRVVVIEEGRVVNDGTPNEILFNGTSHKKSSLKAEVLELKENNGKQIAVVAVAGELLELEVTRKIALGDLISVEVRL